MKVRFTQTTGPDRFVDVTYPDHLFGGLKIEIKQDGKVIWINSPEGCLVRICQIKGKLRIIDRRKN
jgi:hypothetical protein